MLYNLLEKYQIDFKTSVNHSVLHKTQILKFSRKIKIALKIILGGNFFEQYIKFVYGFSVYKSAIKVQENKIVWFKNRILYVKVQLTKIFLKSI